MEMIEFENRIYRKVEITYRGIRVEALIDNENYKAEYEKKKSRRKRVTPYSEGLFFADTWFSLFIRERDNQTCQMPRCSRKKADGFVIEAGHWKGRANMATRYAEDNCHAQCNGHNLRHNYDTSLYDTFMEKKYGEAYMKNLEVKSRMRCKYSTGELMSIGHIYKAKYEKLLQEKKNAEK